MGSHPTIAALTVSAYRIPTDAPEADGTLSWDSTTFVLAEVSAGGKRGIGYSYTDAAAAGLIGGKLAEAIKGMDAFAIPRAWQAMLAGRYAI